MNRSYTELITLPTFRERYEYLRLNGTVGEETFGGYRYLNQYLYRSPEWKHIKRKVIIRDNGCDLGIEGYEIKSRILVHHINPITLDDVLNRSPVLYDLDNLICVSHNTHQAIHYSDSRILVSEPIIRTPNDQCPWRLQ